MSLSGDFRDMGAASVPAVMKTARMSTHLKIEYVQALYRRYQRPQEDLADAMCAGQPFIRSSFYAGNDPADPFCVLTCPNCGVRIDWMKRLAPHSTWWHR